MVTAGQLKLRDGVAVAVAGNGARAVAGGETTGSGATTGNERAGGACTEILTRSRRMQLPEICIKRPVFATVLSLIIVLVGLISYTRLLGARISADRRAGRQRGHRPIAARRPKWSSRR